jgi:hypothetical protein
MSEQSLAPLIWHEPFEKQHAPVVGLAGVSLPHAESDTTTSTIAREIDKNAPRGRPTTQILLMTPPI